MKGIAFFSSRLWVYLTELPVILLLVVAVRNNDAADNVGKLYPLIILLSAVIIFIAIYFFRGVIISNEEIKCVGVFSSKDSAIIKKGRTLAITAMPKKRIKLELFGDGENNPTYEWLRDDLPSEINLFRAKAYGSMRSIERVFDYFEIPVEDIEEAIITNERAEKEAAFEAPGAKIKVFEKEYKNLIFTAYTTEDTREFRIFFKETI